MPYDIPSDNPLANIISGGEVEPYNYGEDEDSLDLRPDSDLSRLIVSECMRRAQAGREAIKAKFPTWRRLDQLQTAYKPLSEKDRESQVIDPTRPVAVVVPASMAILDTLVTYNLATFGELPYFRYRPMSPEDTVGVLKLQAIIELQSTHFGHLVDLHTQIRDSLMYGFGMIVPRWRRQHGQVPVKRAGNTGSMDAEGNITTPEPTTAWEDKVIYEGHELEVPDPYNTIRDPNVPGNKFQEGGYFGWIKRHEYTDLLALEQEGKVGFVNVRYLAKMQGLSTLWEEGRDAATGTSTSANISSKDVMYLYVKLIPHDWKLSASKRPEMWLFGIAADSLVILAQPSILKHGLFPSVCASPESDGHNLLATSKMESIMPSQMIVDFLYNSRVLGIRKGVGGTIVMDPGIINIKDMKRAGPKVVCVSRRHWGRGVKDSWDIIPQDNSTAQNLTDAAAILDMMYRGTAATDAVQGVVRGGSERRTAREYEGTKNSAVSRLQRSARMISEQSMQNLSYIIAMQTQQFATEAVNIKVIGALREQLAKEYGNNPEEYMTVNPEDVMVPFDVIAGDSSIPGTENMDGWNMIMQMLMSNPMAQQEIMRRKDPVKILDHVMREMGAKQVNSFDRPMTPGQAAGAQMPQQQVSVMPDEQVLSEVEKGNMVPV